MTGLPMTVIGGYLGAGKTTLINHLLAAPAGRRITVLVNDFGAVNVDAALIRAAGGDTVELTNGCVCCALGPDLFAAIGRVLDEPMPPDHLVVEASGVADPARIARLALAEPDLRYGGIVTVVDGRTLEDLTAEARIGAQVAEQVRVADLVAVAKTKVDAVRPVLERLGVEAPAVQAGAALASLVLDPDGASGRDRVAGQGGRSAAPHPDYARWSAAAAAPWTRAALTSHVAARPAGVLRLKGFVPARDGGTWEVQVVGRTTDVRAGPADAAPAVVAIGLAQDLPIAALDAWWRAGDPAAFGTANAPAHGDRG